MQKQKIFGILISLIVMGVLVMAGPARAYSLSIDNINDVNKGGLLKFDIKVDSDHVDKAELIIEYFANKNGKEQPHVDKFECFIDDKGSYECVRYKGSMNNPKTYDDIQIWMLGTNLGYGYGYNNPGYGYGYGYGDGYGYQESGSDGLTYHVEWQTPENLHPGQYRVLFNAYIDGKKLNAVDTFNVLTPTKHEDQDEKDNDHDDENEVDDDKEETNDNPGQDKEDEEIDDDKHENNGKDGKDDEKEKDNGENQTPDGNNNQNDNKENNGKDEEHKNEHANDNQIKHEEENSEKSNNGNNDELNKGQEKKEELHVEDIEYVPTPTVPVNNGQEKKEEKQQERSDNQAASGEKGEKKEVKRDESNSEHKEDKGKKDK